MNKIKCYFIDFRKFSIKYNFPKNIYLYFIHWMILRYMYWIDVEGYFKNEVWRITHNHNSYFEHFHKYIHRWKYVYPRYNPGKHSQLYYKVDYFINKLFCPGLDAMDYFRYEFYNNSLEKNKTFITEGGLALMDKKFNGGKNKKYQRELLSNKSSFNARFAEYINRDWISSEDMSFQSFSTFVSTNKNIIVKPINGFGGEGIYKVSIDLNTDISKLYDDIKEKNAIVEEVISQCDELQELNPSSVNTIRIYSVEKGNQIYITGATLRIGNGLGVTDNYSAGGIAATIDIETGIVISPAVSQNNEKYYIHPHTKKVILGLQIPQWYKAVECVKAAHSRITDLRYIGWDVVICQNGSISLLEANTCSGVGLQQHPLCRGVKDIYSPYL